MTRFWLAASLLVVCGGSALAQTTDELVNDGKNPNNVTTQSMGYARQSYSPLKQINASNVKRLVPIWNTSVMNDMGELASPTVYNGVMYVINGKWTFALDVQPEGRSGARRSCSKRVRSAHRSPGVPRRSTTASCSA